MDHYAQIIELRKSGVGPREIARRMDVTNGVVSGVLFRAGMTKPTCGRGNGPTDEVRRAAIKLSDKIGYQRAASHYGVHWVTLYKWARDAA